MTGKLASRQRFRRDRGPNVRNLARSGVSTYIPVMTLSLAIHIIGIVLWLGGVLIATLFANIMLKAGDKAGEAWPMAASKIFWSFAVSGLVVTTLTGLYQLMTRGMAFYMKQGWFHGKLTLLIALFVVTVLVGRDLSRVKNGQPIERKKIMMLHGIAGIIFVAVVMLTMLGRSV